MFRNETSKVVTKAKAGISSESSNRVSATSCRGQLRDGGVETLVTDFSVAPTQMAEYTPAAIRNLSSPIEDVTTYYFFHKFIAGDPSKPGSHGSVNAYSLLLPTLYRQDSSFGVLPKIIDAIGLASISNMKHSPELMYVHSGACLVPLV